MSFPINLDLFEEALFINEFSMIFQYFFSFAFTLREKKERRNKSDL